MAAFTSTQSKSTSGRVLIVDDEPRIRSVVTAFLAPSGYALQEAASTDQALHALTQQPFDVVLVDIEMPERSGLELLDEIAQRRIDVVPVLLTGVSEVATAVAAMKRGAFDYMPKPPNRTLLQFVIERAMQEGQNRRREQELRNVVADWAATFNACPDPITVVDRNDVVLRCNDGACAALPSLQVGRRLDELIPADASSLIFQLLASARHSGEAQKQRVHDRQHGKIYDLFVKAYEGATAILVARDVTEIEQSRQIQAELCRKVLSVQESERARLARELHDGLAQSVVTLAVGLSSLVPMAGEEKDRVEALARTATEILNEMRQLAHGLRPPVLDDIGLIAGLKRLARQAEQLHGLRVELMVLSEPATRLAPEMETALYRIVQEALANVVKHAQARSVDVTFEATTAEVVVSVADDGCGAKTIHDGMGMADMRERAQLLGGTFHFETSIGRGSTVRVALPRGT